MVTDNVENWEKSFQGRGGLLGVPTVKKIAPYGFQMTRELFHDLCEGVRVKGIRVGEIPKPVFNSRPPPPLIDEVPTHTRVLEGFFCFAPRLYRWWPR
jgi:hypothetical protein